MLIHPHHVISVNECPDTVVVREHPERMIPIFGAAIRGVAPVEDELAPEDSS